MEISQKNENTNENSNNSNNSSIISRLFKSNNKQLCKDLQKSETELPFNLFLEKYKCQNKILPKIKTLSFNLHSKKCFTDIEKSTLSTMFNNDKIMKLLNIGQTVEGLIVIFWSQASTSYGKYFIMHCLSSLKNLNALRLRTRTLFDIEKINAFGNDLVDILEQAIKNESIKSVEWDIIKGYYEPSQKRYIEYKITIDNKGELAYANKDKLRNKLLYCIQNSCQAKKLVPSKVNKNNGICQIFKFDRKYVV